MGFIGKLFGADSDGEQQDYHNPYNSQDQSEEAAGDDSDEYNVDVLIHFTPEMTYVYVSESAEIYLDKSGVAELTVDEIDFTISGTYVVLEQVDRRDLDELLRKKFKLDEIGQPFTLIEAD